MRQIPVEYVVHIRIKSSKKGVGGQRGNPLIVLKISDYKVLKCSSHKRVTHNLAALTHNLAAKRVKRCQKRRAMLPLLSEANLCVIIDFGRSYGSELYV